MGNIGDRDPKDEAASVVFGVVCFSEAGVIMVAGIARVDGDQRHVRQVETVAKRRWLHPVRLCDHVIWKVVGDAMLVDCNQRHGLGRTGVAKSCKNARAGQAEAVLGASLFGFDQLAVLGAHRPTGIDTPFLV